LIALRTSATIGRMPRVRARALAATVGLASGLLVAPRARAQPRPPPTSTSTPASARPAAAPPAHSASAGAAPAGAASAGAAAAPRPLAESLGGQAKADYESGKLLFVDGDFAGAEIKFRSAYDKSGDARLLWNVAACEKNQRHYARTVALLQEYLDKGQAVLSDADRAEAKALVAAIEPFTVKLTVVVNEPGAEVSIDDERVGTSPLDRPTVVDIGTRKVTVSKAGFQPWSQSIPIGGSAEAKVDVHLRPEVHEAKLTVTTLPSARVVVDGQVVGVGRFEGKLRSGGHTLRVEAEGMRPYQSEVVLSDDENRSIDVPLETAYAPPPAEAKAPGLELGVSGGPAVKMHGDRPWMGAVRADVGWRAGWPTDLAFYVEYGSIDAAAQCGTDLHGPSPSQPLDLAVRYSFSACRYAKAGLEVVVHFLPAHAFDPWLGVEPGFRATFYDFTRYDPLSGQRSSGHDTMPAIDVGVRLGLDWHPARGYRPWALGPFASLVVTPVADESPDHDGGNNGGNNGGSSSPTPPGSNSDTSGPVHYLSVYFGLRSSLTF